MCLIECMIRGYPINLSYIMIINIIMTYDQKQKSLFYGQVLTSIFEYFGILLTGMNRNSYPKLMKIDNRILTKMKYVLNEDGAWVSKDHIRVHAKEEHDEEKEHNVGRIEEIKAMFETTPLSF